jgi:hypothetical protein
MAQDGKSVRISITIEGSPEDIPAALRSLLGLSGTQETHEQPAATQAEGWSFEKLVRLWTEIAEGAREVLTEIASRPDGYPKEELYAALELDGRTIGGRLSSVGAAMARLNLCNRVTKTGMEWPWSFDGAHYRMKPEVAEMIRQFKAPC